jgi:hypothetical protein
VIGLQEQKQMNGSVWLSFHKVNMESKRDFAIVIPLYVPMEIIKLKLI